MNGDRTTIGFSTLADGNGRQMCIGGTAKVIGGFPVFLDAVDEMFDHDGKRMVIYIT
ncbi:MAG: hypothetical protein J6X55_03965 [Victivallales bacterium]|nr:hypothetical protein [Victivallales bacterium]